MKALIRRYALLVALFVSCAPGVLAQTDVPLPISKIQIRHVGPPAANEDLIRANIRVKPGDPYQSNSIDEDVRTLYSTGYFYNIRIVSDRDEKGVALTYVLQGKPVLTEILFNGNKKYSRSKLLKKLTSKIGEPLDERKLFTDSQEILKLYQKAGRQKTKVEYKPVIDENAGRGTVTFEIAESPRVKIKRVEFVGAQAFKEKKLRKVIKTRKRWAFSWITGSGVLKDEQFEDDKEKLSEFYRNEGYIDFQLQDVKFDQLNPKWMTVRMFISEGRQYKVGTIEFKGNQLFTTEEIKSWIAANKSLIDPAKRKKNENSKGLRLTPGQTFTPTGLTKDIQAIQDFYGSRGYIGKGSRGSIDVKATRIPNTEKGTMDLVYEIEEGEKSYIEKIDIRGNTKTKDKVIRRELSISPGEPFDMVRVKLSKGRLEQMNYFEKVDAEPEPSDAGANRKDLLISVDEKNTGNLLVGAGFSTIDEVVGFAEVSQGNFDLFNPPYFTGGGQKARLRVQMGTKRQDYVLTFIEPWFLGRKLALNVELYHREINYLSDYYDERDTGARIGLTKALGFENLIGGVSYTIENIGIVNVQDGAPQPVKDEVKDGNYKLFSKVGTSIAYDTRNNVALPDRGQRTELLSQVSGGPLGGDVDYYKLELRSSWYFKGFMDGHIIEVLGRTGVMDGFGNTESDKIPFYVRSYLGGMYDLRGFKYHRAGSDATFDAPTQEPLGGNTFWMGSIEYSIPVVDRVRFAVFYDVGNVYRDSYSYNFGDYLDDVGVGLRVNIPQIGPLRFDYGIPISTDQYTGHNGRFNFGVGYTREF
jgi:outer membrane protein insertion porin family